MARADLILYAEPMFMIPPSSRTHMTKGERKIATRAKISDGKNGAIICRLSFDIKRAYLAARIDGLSAQAAVLYA
jgi:hypothetical protein